MTNEFFDSWRLIPLGDIADVELGKMLDGRKNRLGRRIPYLRNLNVRWGSIDLSSVNEMFFRDDELARFSLREGDVLVCEGGEPGRTAIWDGSVPIMMYQKALHRVRFRVPYSPKFFLYFMEMMSRTGNLNPIITGSTIKHLTLKSFVRMSVPDLSLAFQEQVVFDIDTKLSRLEMAASTISETSRHTKRYRSSVLQSAIRGTLVKTATKLAEEGHAPPEEVIQTIARQKRPPRPQKWSSRSLEIIPGHPALAIGNPNTALPNGWEWVLLADIAEMASGHTPSRRRLEWWGGEIPWVGVTDARENHGASIQSTKENISPQGLANSSARVLPTGTVCVSRTASIGYVVVLGRSMATSQAFVNWIPGPAVLSGWLKIIFMADRSALQKFGKGSVHDTIYYPELLSMHIALPPITEQERIVSECDRCLSLAAMIDDTIQFTEKQAERLRLSILYTQMGQPIAIKPQMPFDDGVSDNKPRPQTSQSNHNLRYYETQATTLEELVDRLKAAEGELLPTELLYISRLEDDIDMFFDLIREGSASGVLKVNTGVTGPVQLISHAH